jgi:hypothetical protein
MSFNKRYLSEDSIRSHAKSNPDSFHWFERYMVNADAYIIDTTKGDFAETIYEKFGEGNEEVRREIHRQLVNDEI